MEDAFTSVLKEAAKQTFRNAICTQRKPWITDHTLELLQQEADGDHAAQPGQKISTKRQG